VFLAAEFLPLTLMSFQFDGKIKKYFVYLLGKLVDRINDQSKKIYSFKNATFDVCSIFTPPTCHAFLKLATPIYLYTLFLLLDYTFILFTNIFECALKLMTRRQLSCLSTTTKVRLEFVCSSVWWQAYFRQ
jgi:hypothetical protein